MAPIRPAGRCGAAGRKSTDMVALLSHGWHDKSPRCQAGRLLESDEAATNPGSMWAAPTHLPLNF